MSAMERIYRLGITFFTGMAVASIIFSGDATRALACLGCMFGLAALARQERS